jgi:hypothetical protein
MGQPAKKPTLANLKASVIGMGGSVDDEGLRYGWINLDAPPGMVWACSGDIHALLVDWGGPGYENWPARWKRDAMTQAITDAFDRLSYGTAPCTDPECDYCHPEE